MDFDLIVVGGGPAGMLGAAAAGAKGLKVILLEKNDRLGKSFPSPATAGVMLPIAVISKIIKTTS